MEALLSWLSLFCCKWILIPLMGMILCVIYFLLKVDADLTLYYYDKRGRHANVLSGKVVWITGASSGIGEHLAYELARCGCRLVLSGTNADRLAQVKSRCIQYGMSANDVLVLPFNLCDHDEHGEQLDNVIRHFGKLDILVNNAGRSQRAQFLDIDLDVDKQIFELNVFATLSLSRHVLRYFLEHNCGKGHFVVTSSCVGKLGAPGSASYTGSKHALHGYFESLRTEMTGKKIAITMVCPGPVFSNFLANAFTDKPGEKFGGSPETTDRRMATDRCAQLMAVAMAYQLDEAWIAIQPCLLLYYLAQYTPTFFRKVLIEKFYTPERATKFREGKW